MSGYEGTKYGEDARRKSGCRQFLRGPTGYETMMLAVLAAAGGARPA